MKLRHAMSKSLFAACRRCSVLGLLPCWIHSGSGRHELVHAELLHAGAELAAHVDSAQHVPLTGQVA